MRDASTNPQQTAAQAEILMKNYIGEKVNEYKKLMKEGATDAAYEALGMAMHPLMDSTSPSHEGMQGWKSPWTHPLDAYEHRKKETAEIFNSNPTHLQKNINLLREFYDANK